VHGMTLQSMGRRAGEGGEKEAGAGDTDTSCRSEPVYVLPQAHVSLGPRGALSQPHVETPHISLGPRGVLSQPHVEAPHVSLGPCGVLSQPHVETPHVSLGLHVPGVISTLIIIR